MILKLSELRVAAFAQFARKWKDHCYFVDIEYQKLICHSVTRWLSLYPSLPRMPQMYPASHSYFMSIDKPLFWNVFWKFSERILFNTLRHFLQSFVVAFNEQVQNIEMSKASIIEVESCFATVKARIRVRQSDIHIKPS